MEDRQIVDLYWQRSSEAIAQSQQKYGAYCYAVSHNILQNREDAQECVNDTWLQAWNAMPPQRPTYLSAFLAKITRNLAFNRWNSRSAETRGGGELPLVLEELAECVAAPSDVEQEYNARELEQAVSRFLRGLPAREANVFLRRCFFTEPLPDIARRYGLSENHVSVLLSRTRKKLRNFLAKEGFLP